MDLIMQFESESNIPDMPPLPKRLSRPLKKNFDHWLNWDYYGQKVTYDALDDNDTPIEKTQIIAVNPIKSVNFWSEKSNLTGKGKQATVADTWGLYRRDEIRYDEVLNFVNPISQRKIISHFYGYDTYYYCNSPSACVVNLMLDWDDKDQIHGDTEDAARWVDLAFQGQSYIQPSTSLTGTHQYVFVQTTDPTDDQKSISVVDQKRVYAELVPLLRLALRDHGFRCWEGLDQIKGVAPVVTWQRSEAKRHVSNPWYPRMITGGIFAKLPRLPTTQDEDRWLNRKIVTWNHLLTVLRSLRQKYDPNHQNTGKGKTRDIVGVVSEVSTVSFPADGPREETVPEQVRRHVRLSAMLEGGGKQQAALAAVFTFELERNRRPTAADYPILNLIYNRSATATGTELTHKRCQRFEKAIRFSSGRSKITCKRLIGPEAIQKAERHFARVELRGVNKRLSKAKQRAVTAFDVARVWCYFDQCYRNPHKEGKPGQVAFASIIGLADADHRYDPKLYRKLSRHAVTAIIDLFLHLKLIVLTEEHTKVYGAGKADQNCRTFGVLANPAELDRRSDATGAQ